MEINEKINGSIYMIYNQVNNKVYIGQTIRTVEERFKQHLKLCKSNNGQAIYKAIKSLGKDQFSYEVLKDGIHTYDELNIWEQYYISLYNSIVPNGYNLCPGGQMWRHHSHLTEIDHNEMCRMYIKGSSSREIASHFGVCPKTVLGVLHKHNIQIRSRACKLPDRSSVIDYDTLFQKYCIEKMLIKDIAIHFNVSTKSVQRAINRYNLREYNSSLIS